MKSFINNFLIEEDGVSIIEYGLIAAVVAVGSISALSQLKDGIGSQMSSTETALKVDYNAGATATTPTTPTAPAG